MSLLTEKDVDDLYSRQPFWVEHVAGEYDQGIQLCTRCHETICNDRGSMSPQGPIPSIGFPPGKIYRSGRCTSIQRPNANVIACGLPD